MFKISTVPLNSTLNVQHGTVKYRGTVYLQYTVHQLEIVNTTGQCLCTLVLNVRYVQQAVVHSVKGNLVFYICQLAFYIFTTTSAFLIEKVIFA